MFCHTLCHCVRDQGRQTASHNWSIDTVAFSGYEDAVCQITALKIYKYHTIRCPVRTSTGEG